MKIITKGPYKHRGHWCARVIYQGDDGRVHSKEQRAKTRAEAKALSDSMAADLQRHGEDYLKADRLTFRQLCESFRKYRLIEAVWAGERKIAGYKHPKKVETKIKTLEEYFGPRLIRSIDYTHLERFKLHLLKVPTRLVTKQRSIADVNHHMRLLRYLFNYAIQNRWLADNPFKFGRPLISAADETPRDRPEQPGERERIIAACVGRREHLRIIIIGLIDTGLRYSELQRVLPGDVDLENRIIEVRQRITKVNRRRFVPISDRLAVELSIRMPPLGPLDPVFGGYHSIKMAWWKLCEDLGIEDLRVHDLRHWAAQEITDALAAAGQSHKVAMAILGHSQEATFQRYLTKSQQKIQEAGRAIEDYRRQKQKRGEESIGGVDAFIQDNERPILQSELIRVN